MIKVTDILTGSIIFTGDMELFLELHEYNEDLELFLQAFEMKRVDSDIFRHYLIEKELYLI